MNGPKTSEGSSVPQLPAEKSLKRGGTTNTAGDNEYEDANFANNVNRDEAERDDGTRQSQGLPPLKRMRLTSTTISTTSVASVDPTSPLAPPPDRAPPTSRSNSPPIPHECHFCSSRNECTISPSLPDHRLQNITTTQHLAPSCDGYNHSKVVEKFPQCFVDYKIPSWLADISQCKTPQLLLFPYPHPLCITKFSSRDY